MTNTNFESTWTERNGAAIVLVLALAFGALALWQSAVVRGGARQMASVTQALR